MRNPARVAFFNSGYLVLLFLIERTAQKIGNFINAMYRWSIDAAV